MDLVEVTVSKWLPEPTHPATYRTPVGVGNVGGTHICRVTGQRTSGSGLGDLIRCRFSSCWTLAFTGCGASMLLDTAVGADASRAPLKTDIRMMCESQLMIKTLNIICSDVENLLS